MASSKSQVKDAVGSKDTSQHRIGCAAGHILASQAKLKPNFK